MQLQLANEAIESRAIEKNEVDAIKGMTEIEDATDQEDQAQDEKEEEKERKVDPYDNAKKIAVVPSLLMRVDGEKSVVTSKRPGGVASSKPLRVTRTMAGLARRLGPSSPDIVRVIASSSLESRPLILHIVQALAKSSAPAPLPKALVNACETLAIESTKDRDSSLPDAYMEVALVFGSIEKDKAKEFLPKLVDVASPSVFERRREFTKFQPRRSSIRDGYFSRLASSTFEVRTPPTINTRVS